MMRLLMRTVGLWLVDLHELLFYRVFRLLLAARMVADRLVVLIGSLESGRDWYLFGAGRALLLFWSLVSGRETRWSRLFLVSRG